jgi:hypothetical protein
MSPLAILAVVAIIVVLIIVAVLIISALSGGGADADPLAKEPGHDHSNGADNCAACQASSNPVGVKVPEKCIVHFRPASGYSGEYGFDWLRDGKSGLPGDIDYETIVGNHTNNNGYGGSAFNVDTNKFKVLRKGSYLPFNSSWKKNTDDSTYVYATPCLSIFPEDQCKDDNKKKCEAKLTLHIEVVGKKPETLRIDYDASFFELTPSEISAENFEIGTHKIDITIKCKKEFGTDQAIEIFPYKAGKYALAGKLMVLKNDKPNRYKANVVNVRITTQLSATSQVHVGGIDAGFNDHVAPDNELAEKYLLQSLTTLNLASEVLSIDVTKDNTFITEFVIPHPTAPGTLALNARKNSDNNSNIHTYLEAKLNNPKYDNKWFKVFYIQENTFSGTFAFGGEANKIDSKSVALYTNYDKSTPAHELLHAMGLYHTFDNSGAYTYKIYNTDNIMDYSALAPAGTPKIEQISTYKWQWLQLQRTTLSKE